MPCFSTRVLSRSCSKAASSASMSLSTAAMAVCSGRSAGTRTLILFISDLLSFARVPLAKKAGFRFQNVGVVIYPALSAHAVGDRAVFVFVEVATVFSHQNDLIVNHVTVHVIEHAVRATVWVVAFSLGSLRLVQRDTYAIETFR